MRARNKLSSFFFLGIKKNKEHGDFDREDNLRNGSFGH